MVDLFHYHHLGLALENLEREIWRPIKHITCLNSNKIQTINIYIWMFNYDVLVTTNKAKEYYYVKKERKIMKCIEFLTVFEDMNYYSLRLFIS